MSKKFNPKTNPRFMLVIGAIREVFPDIPDSIDGEGVVLWDRQEKKESGHNPQRLRQRDLP